MAASLRAALSDALAGRSGFSFTDGQQGLDEVPRADLSAHAGHPVLWPMANDALCVRRLFEALHAGVVPVVLPKATAPQKLADLRARYAGFGFFDGSAIEPSATPVKVDPRTFLVLLTSGSTGVPKLVAIDEPALSAGVAAIHAAQRLDDVASTGVLLPLAYSYALVNQLLWALLFERRVSVLSGLIDPLGTLDALREQRLEMLCLVAHQIQTLASLGLDDQRLESVRTVNFAGAPFPVSSFPMLQAMFPAARFYNNYGCTEAMPRLAVVPVEDAAHPVTRVGRPIRTVELRIGGSEPVGPIEFRGASASIGFMAPDGRLEAHGDWIASGDLGRLDDGVLHVMGRHDQIVKVGGERFSLIEIENVMLGAGFDQALVWQDKTDTEGRILCVGTAVQRPGSSQLASHLRRTLPRPMWPKTVFWIDDWPLMASGKTDRTLLQRRAGGAELDVVFPANTGVA